MGTTGVNSWKGIYWDNGKENGNYYSMGLYRDCRILWGPIMEFRAI